MARSFRPDPDALALSEEQVLYFRARRLHLAGSGAESPRAAARAMLGGQSQQLGPSLLALALRTRGRPRVGEIAAMLMGEPRSLVRAWGQRETLHLYDPEAHWAKVVAARAEWAPGGRRGPMPPEEAVDRAYEAVDQLGEATRSDLMELVPANYLAEVEPFVEGFSSVAGAPLRFAAGRLIWCLALRGQICHAGKKGQEQAYALRRDWFAGLPWPSVPIDPLEAAADLTRDYLSAYGPATTTDIAHFFGARVREAKGWVKALQAEGALLSIACGDRKGLLALAGDGDALRKEPPASSRAGGGGWPPRLLPLWDAYWMGHKDKSWTVPEEADRKRIWRKAGVVAAVLVARGRAVAIWSQKIKKGRLYLQVEPLSGWRVSKHRPALLREVKELARQLDLKMGEVQVDPKAT